MSNLPPGVTDSMIPGNRPEDVLADTLTDDLAAFITERYGISWNTLHEDGYDLLDRMTELLLELVTVYGNGSVTP